eukprot:CAMPEP_0172301856 /NCGR_PEP_ID=MMETSP1058-20130122/3675_1 /TAXON_ID=83371 /ORGANISM="Detonula confervacea, Strain CCMP 353" /LENGTH=41 /DNA_ID= /DNA_START= /DNA_END= /DNA_ORIENTATION=
MSDDDAAAAVSVQAAAIIDDMVETSPLNTSVLLPNTLPSII